MSDGYIGQSVPRREDQRLLAGRGRFLADQASGAHHVVFLRSSQAHARIDRIDGSRATEMPGVLGFFTAAELDLEGVPIPLLTRPEVEFSDATRCVLAEQRLPVLASHRVHYIGQPIAVLIAEDRYRAEDALEMVEVDYTRCPPSPTPRRRCRLTARCCSTISPATRPPGCGTTSVIPLPPWLSRTGWSPAPTEWAATVPFRWNAAACGPNSTAPRATRGPDLHSGAAHGA